MTVEDRILRKVFEGMNEHGFAKWLEDGFRAYYAPLSEPEPPSAFGLAHGFAQARQTIVERLASVYQDLVPTEKKEAFRRAIGVTLHECASRPAFPAEAMVDLLYLIPEVDADEALYALPSIVAGRASKPDDWLLAESIAILKQLLPSKEAQTHLYALVSSTQFEYKYSYGVLKRLCRDVPHRWLEHCKLLSGHLDRFREEALSQSGLREKYEMDTFSLLAGIANDVPLEYITSRLTPSDMDSLRAPVFRGTWRLLNALFSTRDSPFAYASEPIAEEYEYFFRMVIWRKDRPEVMVSADVEPQTYYALFGKLPDGPEEEARIMSGLTPQARRHLVDLKTSFSSP